MNVFLNALQLKLPSFAMLGEIKILVTQRAISSIFRIFVPSGTRYGNPTIEGVMFAAVS
jgi:hypothetical protein